MKYDTAQPYIASYVIVRDGKKVAFLLRSNTAWMNGFYSLPAGKVEKGESFSTAATREALEEIGATVTEANLRHVLTVHRQEEDDHGDTRVDVYFEATKVEGRVYNAEPDVHGELAWFDLQKLPENVVPSVRAAFGFIAEGKKFAEWGWDK